MRRLVDLSMPVHADMLTFPRVPPPYLVLYESWQEFAERIGAAQYGATSLTASYLVVQNDHVGTHLDAVKHIRGPEAPGVEGIPLEYCFSDGVVLDFRHKENGAGIRAAEIDEALASGAAEQAEALQAELDQLVGQLAQAFGLGGRSRRASSAAERARLNVTRALRAAITKVSEALPPAGTVLDRRIRTGLYCAYEPDERDEVRWIVQS